MIHEADTNGEAGLKRTMHTCVHVVAGCASASSCLRGTQILLPRFKNATDMHLESGRAKDAQFSNDVCAEDVAGIHIQPHTQVPLQFSLRFKFTIKT